MTTSDRSRINHRQWRVIFAVSAGNALEWFDFIIYGYFAVAIAKHFFPAGNQATPVLWTLATFGAAFVMRPFGAIVIGNYADRRGRKPALTLTIALMMIGTAIITFAPTFNSIGLGASALVVGARIIQGFSAGGEFGSATALLAEQDPTRRGFFTSWQFSSQAMTAVLAAAAGTLLVVALGDAQFNAWGWRLSFAFGLMIGPVAYYIRRRIDESPEFHISQNRRGPFREVLSCAKAPLLIAVGTIVIATVATYTLIYLPTFAVRQLGLPLYDAFGVGLTTSATQVLLVPIAGALSDRWGRLPIAYATTTAILFTAYPLFFWLVASPSAISLFAFQFCTGVLLAAYLGTLPAMLSEMFPTRTRTTGLSLSYSLAVATFGGFAPFINASLIDLTGSKLIPCYYLMFGAAITLPALLGARRLGLK